MTDTTKPGAEAPRDPPIGWAQPNWTAEFMAWQKQAEGTGDASLQLARAFLAGQYSVALRQQDAPSAGEALRELVEAAKPFVANYAPWMDSHTDESNGYYAVTNFGQQRRLRKALEALAALAGAKPTPSAEPDWKEIAEAHRKSWIEACAALWTFQNPPDPKDLRAAADEIDCQPGCERCGFADPETGTTECPLTETTGCPNDTAENLRSWAKAVETRAALASAEGQPGGVDRCTKDGAPCRVSGDEPHWRCGTSACGLSTPNLPAPEDARPVWRPIGEHGQPKLGDVILAQDEEDLGFAPAVLLRHDGDTWTDTFGNVLFPMFYVPAALPPPPEPDAGEESGR